MSEVDPERFIYIKIQCELGPIDRGDQYEDPLGVSLAEPGLGEITGGGSQLGDDKPDGSPSIAFCGVDVVATDRDGALALLRSRLARLGVPIGSEILYTTAGAMLQDVFRTSGLAIGLPRTYRHPYFGC